MGDIVSAAQTDPVLTSPLGPLVSGMWDAVVSHPKIPLIDPTEQPSGGATATRNSATAAGDLSKYTGGRAARTPADTSGQIRVVG